MICELPWHNKEHILPSVVNDLISKRVPKWIWIELKLFDVSTYINVSILQNILPMLLNDEKFLQKNYFENMREIGITYES